MVDSKTQVILALDVESRSKAESILEATGDKLQWVKIGLQTYLRDGPEFLRDVAASGKSIFLDLKLHDIPNTVEKGLKAILKLKPLFTTIHISGGDDMQKITALKNNKITQILGVTILTSLDKNQTLKYYKEKNVKKLVTKFAHHAKKNNINGLVCSPLEIKTLRKEMGKKMVLVVPGIRLKNNTLKKKDDQKRTLTPKEAIDLGADFLVIGRPIVESKNPLETIKKINKSIQ